MLPAGAVRGRLPLRCRAPTVKLFRAWRPDWPQFHSVMDNRIRKEFDRAKEYPAAAVYSTRGWWCWHSTRAHSTQSPFIPREHRKGGG